MAEKKKAQTLVSIHGNEATQVFDYSKFKTAYDGWKNDCGISGEALKIKSSKSLLDLVSAHGDVQVARPYTDDPVDDGAGNVIELLDKIMEYEIKQYKIQEKKITEFWKKKGIIFNE